jgi:hypothetical protein
MVDVMLAKHIEANTKGATRFRANESGSTLLTVLGAMSIITAVALGLLTITNNRSQIYQSGRLTSERDALILKVRRDSRVGLTLYSTISPEHKSENLALYKCVIFDVNDVSGDCHSNTWTPMTIYNDDNLRVSGNSPQSLQYFDAFGAQCDPAKAKCPFGTWTEFSAICDSGAAVCTVAKGVSIRVHVVTVGENTYGAKNDRVLVQYVPVIDMDFGAWSPVGYDRTKMLNPGAIASTKTVTITLDAPAPPTPPWVQAPPDAEPPPAPVVEATPDPTPPVADTPPDPPWVDPNPQVDNGNSSPDPIGSSPPPPDNPPPDPWVDPSPPAPDPVAAADPSPPPPDPAPAPPVMELPPQPVAVVDPPPPPAPTASATVPDPGGGTGGSPVTAVVTVANPTGTGSSDVQAASCGVGTVAVGDSCMAYSF